MLKSNVIQKVVITGGGTAGWMAAAALSKTLGKQLSITLVESDEIGTVGVGEATIPTLIYFHRLLELNESDLMAATQATFKLGIQFEHWRAKDQVYFHAFGHTGRDCWACGFQHFWRKGLDQNITANFGDYCLEHQAALAGKFAQLPKNGLNYAYHLDATLYAKFLRKFSENLGVKRIEGKIAQVLTHADNGHIQALQLANGQKIEGDLFIDCTGFSALLIEKALHVGYEDWSHWLPCDSAVAIQTTSTEEPRPYTRSIAHEFGWQWRIPLQHRSGNGLVYCSRYVSDDEASQRLMNNLPGEPLTELRKLTFRTGKRQKQWQHNCVALGLASGFLEPLESTSIHLISSGIIRLLELFPLHGINESEIKEFNKQTDNELIGIRDFIILHYKVTERRDSPFWQRLALMEIPATLADKINLFQQSGRVLRERNELFEDSWQQVMLGQGILPESYHPIVNNMSEQELTSFLKNIREQINHSVSRLPTHQQFLAQYCRATPP